MIHIDIDTDELARVGRELGATPKQVQLAFSRALSRTAATLRKLSERGLRDELQLRAVKFIRLRLRSIRLKRGDEDAIRLWYGQNDIPVGEFKGRPSKTATGAAFLGRNFKGGFLGKNKRRQPTIFMRKSEKAHPIKEATMPVKDRMDVFIEDNIFDKTDAIFFGHFERDLSARVKYKIGKSE